MASQKNSGTGDRMTASQETYGTADGSAPGYDGYTGYTKCRLCPSGEAPAPPMGDGICEPCSHRMEVLELGARHNGE